MFFWGVYIGNEDGCFIWGVFFGKLGLCENDFYKLCNWEGF